MEPLPYRADPADVRRYLLAVARGRTPQQLRENEFASKTLDGLSSAAEALGLTAERNGGLSSLGRRFATAPPESSHDVAEEILRSFEPYAALLVAARSVGEATPLEWVQTWWAEHEYGTSDSNRTEAAPVFARFVEAAGLGRYVQGRKGRSSRIVWNEEPLLPLQAERPDPHHAAQTSTGSAGEGAKPRAVAGLPPPAAPRTAGQPNLLSWELSPGKRMVCELPSDLSDEERRLALRVLTLLIDGD